MLPYQHNVLAVGFDSLESLVESRCVPSSVPHKVLGREIALVVGEELDDIFE